MAQQRSKLGPAMDDLLAKLQEVAAAAGELPTGDEHDFHRAFRGFPKTTARMSQQATKAMDRIGACNFAGSRAVDFEGTPAHMRQGVVVDAVDTLREVVADLVDHIKGEKLRAQEQLDVKFGAADSDAAAAATHADFATKFSRHLRPQRTFKTPVDNSAAPFRPMVFDAAGALTHGEPGVHPLEAELRAFRYTDAQLTAGAETPYLPLDQTPLVCVGTDEELQAMVEELRGEPELAIDLEHHSYHSYQGFTCLMQLSTRTADYIIDTLAVRETMWRLGPLLQDPAVVKVLHGAVEDIKWLQKDFGLYVVNMFDTGIALQTLHMPRGLAFLVDHFCQVKLDKQYQTADWRVRPMPGPMVSYARQDTHYLLYCYDRLRALLLQADARGEGAGHVSNLLIHALDEARRLCGTTYRKDVVDPDQTWRVALGRSIGGLDATQLAVVQAVYNWRDAAARDADESPPAVAQTAAVLAIATRLPTTGPEVVKVAHPATVFVRQECGAIAELVRAAMEAHGGSAPAAPAAPTQAAQASGPARPVGLRHLPMTGTLPSVDPDTVAAAPAAYAVAAPAVDVPAAWVAAMKAPAQAPLRVSLPAYTGPAVAPSKPEAAPVSKPGARKAEDDDDDADEDDVAAAPAPAPEAKEKEEKEEGLGLGDEVKLPPSLRDEYGGLGRDTRRRAGIKPTLPKRTRD